MKLLSAIFTLCCVFVLKAQTKRALNYEGGYNGQVTKKKYDLAHLNMSLKDSVYFIRYIAEEDAKVKFNRFFIGTYSINSKGILHLEGKHPFRGNDFLIVDTIVAPNKYELEWGYKEKREIYFETVITESLSTKSGYKMKINNLLYKKNSDQPYWEGEGCCGPEFFYPQTGSIFKEESVRDSVFNELRSKLGTKCNIKEKVIPPDYAKYNYSEYTSFYVDSIRFDTLYINRLFLQKQSVYHIAVDTICLSRTAKIRVTDLQSNYIHLPEHTGVFEQPDTGSAFLYDRGETDQIEDIKILDYIKDGARIEWIKVELDLRIFNDDAKETDEQYISKKITGWILQKYLFVG